MDQGTNAPSGPRVLKWSSKQTDRTARVRNNQRRHREKVRSYIAHLETELAETQTRLRRALEEIRRLNGEHVSPTLDSSMSVKDAATTDNVRITRLETFTVGEIPRDCCMSASPRSISAIETAQTDAPYKSCASNTRKCSGASTHETEMCYTESTTTKEQAPSNSIQKDPILSYSPTNKPSGYAAWREDSCRNLQPPSAHESTTRCHEAYVMISEQNYTGLQASIIYRKLRPGFRGPIQGQGGCRVDNQLLFSLLDQISCSENAAY